MSALRYGEVIRQLESRVLMPERAPTLSIMKEGLKYLLPQLNESSHGRRALLVAGTNGKGSVCATLESLLLSANQRVGLYTSPHLVDTRERIRINGSMVSEEDFCTLNDQVEQILGQHWDPSKLRQVSHFEWLTFMTAYSFYRKLAHQELDWLIFEVGLGGTWDATNALPHDYCVITSLGLDHQNILGSGLSEIASNKFGIIGPGAQVIHAPLPSEISDLAQSVQARTKSRWFETPRFQLKVEIQNQTPVFLLRTPWHENDQWTPLSLPGQRGALNASIALKTFEQLGFSPSLHLKALSQVNWPGRMEQVRLDDGRSIYLSGDHNPQGIESLLEILNYYPRKHLWLLIGIGQDKDLDGIFTRLALLENASLVLTESPFRGRKLADYGRWMNLAAWAHPHPMEALDSILRKAKPDDLIVVTGSLYLIGNVIAQLRTRLR